MKAEKGFIFPSTMVIVLFCLLVVTHLSTTLISDKKFYFETEQKYILENLMTVAVNQTLKELRNTSGELQQPKTITTQNGSFTYKMTAVSSELTEVNIKCETIENRKYQASYQYNSLKNEISVWSENLKIWYGIKKT
ncbi:competence type IV pilus minor pilin ComGG [Metabacillus litoralis]|uniref:competence type IV pilus minor pilin ComGG n=1 Tax=Metabacillus litoralis TaxID=152268 RepID=UPI001CFF0E90|nr:competence type IV pilus minor pilin ComGG [Metabacillus litoralis]